jgi:acetyltransferase
VTIRNLEFMLRPRSVALIGASTTPHSVGATVARNLFGAGFEGPVMPVNPHHDSIEGVLTYPNVASLPVTPDLAVIATPPDTVPPLIAELAARGTKAAVVISAGFGEGSDTHGADLRRAMLEAARPHTLRIVGPNCLGLMVPGIRLNATFAHINAAAGDLAFVSQSGAVIAAVLDWAASHGIGFSHLISVGDMADVDFGDLLDYLALDSGTRAILLYIEAVTNARKFMSAARAAARAKPVVVVKAGRFEAGKKAAHSHTGALAGSDAAYDAAFNRAGLLRVLDIDELFDAVETLALATPPSGERLVILTNGGGFGVLATDSLIEGGGKLAELSPETMSRLDAFLPRTWSRNNPVDIIGDAGGERYAKAFSALLDDPEIDAILVLNCPTAVASSTDAARAVVATLKDRRKCVLTSWIGGAAMTEARELFAAERIPTYLTPGQAIRAFLDMVAFRRNQELLMETPPSIPGDFAPDKAKARDAVDKALSAKREWLTEPEAKSILAAYQIPSVETLMAATPEEAAARAEQLGIAVAVKILSPDITHKSDLGGVALDVAPPAVRNVAQDMLARIKKLRPEANIQGFSVEPMIRRPGAFELIIGMAEDLQFGPLILFGQGGVAVEVVGDSALSLPPLNIKLARDQMARTRIYKQLVGYRGRPSADLDAIAFTLVKVSQLVIDIPEIIELDINPLLADEKGVLALDARIRLAKTRVKPGEETKRFAIRPYPSELEGKFRLSDGTEIKLHPVRPEDEPSLRAGFARLSASDVRMRFFFAMKTLPHNLAARLTQIDYDREMAFVAFLPKPSGDEGMGIVRLVADPDNRQGEFAIVVDPSFRNRGLGRLLMERIIAHGKQRGLGEIFGHVLEDNAPMRKLCRSLGFAEKKSADDPDVIDVTMPLQR